MIPEARRLLARVGRRIADAPYALLMRLMPPLRDDDPASGVEEREATEAEVAEYNARLERVEADLRARRARRGTGA